MSKSIKINSWFVASVIAVVGYIKYERFINFIDNLKLGLNIVEVENGYAVANINNLNTKHIPYKFSSVDLLLDKTTHLATNNDKSTNLSIVPFSAIPINFRMVQPVSKDVLENAEIAIKYNFFGFDFTRLYKPTIQTPQTAKKSSCGCQKF